MSNWEYKIISSGKGGFASPALLEKFLNDLGQENWEIISFHQPSDNALAFHGLARRTTQRDWTLEDAAKAAARAEADKLRAEFEAKFKAGTGQGAAAPEEEAETFLAEEKVGAEGSLRRLRDTSRDDDPETEEESANAPKDEWDKLAEEDELPAFFDALRPHMRRNQRGPGMSVGVDFLAKKWHLDEGDIKTALVECGLQIPADENAKPVYVEYEGELYWVNINRRGEIWINLRDKPQPVFRIVQGKRVEQADEPASAAQPADGQRADESGPRTDERGSRSEDGGRRHENRERGTDNREPEPQAPKTFLGKLRGMMRRNRHGHGWSGSFQYLTKALKTDDAGLIAQLAEQGLKLNEDPAAKPLFHEEGDLLYWLQKNQRGEIWINARKGRADDRAAKSEDGGQAAEGGGPKSEDNVTAGAPKAAPDEAVPTSEAAPMPAGAPSVSSLPVENILTAVRLLMQPKKRGEGVTASLAELAEKLEKTPETVQSLLTSVGLQLPDSPKGKPTFAEHGGEIYWLNANAKGQVWLNAKAAAATKKGKGRKADSEE